MICDLRSTFVSSSHVKSLRITYDFSVCGSVLLDELGVRRIISFTNEIGVFDFKMGSIGSNGGDCCFVAGVMSNREQIDRSDLRVSSSHCSQLHWPMRNGRF